jgi:Transposase, Mutator family
MAIDKKLIDELLEELEAKLKAYPSVSQVWRRNWARITPFFHYPLDIRKAIYTTNSVESLNRSLRKIIKTRGGFPNEEAALKLLFLALRQAAKKWTMPNPPLARSLEPLHDSVARADAGLRESGAMRSQNPSTGMWAGEGYPPCTLSPSQNRVVYTEELTHLSNSVCSIAVVLP